MLLDGLALRQERILGGAGAVAREPALEDGAHDRAAQLGGPEARGPDETSGKHPFELRSGEAFAGGG